MPNGRPNRPIRPRGGGPAGRKRRVVIDSGNQRPRPGDSRQRGQGRDGAQKSEKQQAVQPTGPVTVESGVTVRDFSQALGVPMGEIIKILMGLGQMKTATQSLADDEVEVLAAEIGREITIKHAADEEDEAPVFEDAEETLVARPPVV